MIGQIFLSRFSIILLVLSILFAIVSYWGIQHQFYFWEFFIDLKVVSLICLIVVSWKQQWIILLPEHISLFQFSWKPVTAIFFLPIVFYVITIIIGFLGNVVTIQPLDNAATLILATLFDIPAIFVFSIISFLIEEITFRGVLLHSFRKRFSLIKTLVLVNGLWTVYCVTEILTILNVTLLIAIVIGIFYFSVGYFCSVIALINKSIWPGYSFRVGLFALTPIILSSLLAESDSFFVTSSLFFVSEGLLVSACLVILSSIVLRKVAHFEVSPAK